MDELVRHEGGCHCGAVRWVARALAHLEVWDCNCSICNMKSNAHFIVPHRCFELVCGEDALTEYRFNTKKARHLFCKHCGVQSFYQPRSNPDGYGVSPNCITSDTVTGVTRRSFDGENWEASMATSDIAGKSK